MIDLQLKAKGFPYEDDIILWFIGGSQLHGAKLEDTDDTDYYGVFVPPPDKLLGLDTYEHFVWSSSSKDQPNASTDTDIVLYSLKKWAALAAKGNPTAVQFLFAPSLTEGLQLSLGWENILANKDLFLAKSHLGAYLGYANAQMDRLQGKRGQKNVHRKTLESEHGFDTKYAMHIIRLLDEGRELMETGNITLPRPNSDYLIAVRNGEVPLDELTRDFEETLEAAKLAQENSPLPERVDRDKISGVLVDACFTHWGR